MNLVDLVILAALVMGAIAEFQRRPFLQIVTILGRLGLRILPLQNPPCVFPGASSRR